MSHRDKFLAGTSRRSVLRLGALGGVGALGFSAVSRTGAEEDGTTITECQVIDEPGEYYIGNDISADGTCLEIDSSGVTIHGNGHTLQGSGNGVGIRGWSAQFEVRNLTINGFETGMLSTHSESRFENVTFEQNVESGVLHREHESTYLDCTFHENGDRGVQTGDYSHVTLIDCEMRGNDGPAVSTGTSTPVFVQNCHISDNGGGVGIAMKGSDLETEILDTRILNNGGPGIRTGGTDSFNTEESVPIHNCEIRDNDGPGIVQSYGFLDIRDCTLAGNEDGYRVRDSDPAKAILQYNNIEDNEEFGLWVEDPNDHIEGPIDATCNWWGHESGPEHEDNPNENPQGDRVSGAVTFIPWSVERIEDDEGQCEGGQDDRTTITECQEIDEPGEYVLGDDLSAEGNCMRIRASDVTLDGGGHRIEGDGTGFGISILGSNVTIRDLTVRNFDHGIEVRWGSSFHMLDVTIEQNITYGLRSEKNSTIDCEDSTFRENGRGGINMGDYDDLLTVRNSEFLHNDGRPISAGSSSPIAVIDCTVVGNGGPIALTPMPDAEITRTVIRDNDRGGISTPGTDVIYLDEPVPIMNCDIRDNNGPGIEHSHSSLEIRGCTLAGNEDGYRLAPGDRVKAILQYNNIEDNEEYGVWVIPSIDVPIDATCNWWGHESGPVHEDNPTENPQGDRVSDGVTFTPWSVERIEDGEGLCEGGVDDEPDAPPEGGTGYVAKKSFRKIMGVGPYKGVDCWGGTFYVTDPSDVESAGFDGPGEITVPSSSDDDADSYPLPGHVIRAESDAVPVTLPTWGGDQGDCESLLFVDPDHDLHTDVEYRIVTDDPGSSYENVETNGFAGTIDEIVQVDFEPARSEEASDT